MATLSARIKLLAQALGADIKILRGQIPKATTYETLFIDAGNQTINIRDANKVVGFTLISSSRGFSSSSGFASGTWILGNERDRIRCYIQTLEDPYIKFLVCTLEVINTNNTIVITNKAARFWNHTAPVPQSSMSNETAYELRKLILIRSE